MRHLIALATVWMACVFASGPVAAQAPEMRRGLADIERSLNSLTDSTEVRRLERRFAAQRQDDSLASLGRVLALLRLDQLGNPWAARQAVGEARAVTKRRADWPVAWHILGQSYLAEGTRKEQDPRELGRRVGFGEYEDAAAVLSRAATLEPTYLPALLDLQSAVTATRDTTRLSTLLLPALRAAAEAGVSAPPFLLYLGRVELEIGSPERAQDAFRAYLREGGVRGTGLRELARASFAADDSSAATAYYDGARVDDSASVAEYRADIALIASEPELAEFDRASGDARSDWLRQFWTDRDREALRTEGERLAEHYRRLARAEHQYTLQANRRLDSYELQIFLRSLGYGSQFGEFSSEFIDLADSAHLSFATRGMELPRWWTTNYFDLAHALPPLPDSTRFDERGRVYIRQGEPDTIIETVAFGVSKNETWLYRRADGDLMLHFGGVPEDVRLRPRLGAILLDGSNSGGVPGAWFLYNDRCAIWVGYCKAMVWGRYGVAKLRDEEERIVASSILVATGTDAHELQFSREVEFEAAAFAAGRSGDSGLVHLTWRYRPGAIPSTSPGTEVVLPTRVRAALFDSQGHAIGWRDTTLSVRVRAGDSTVAQVGRIGLTAPPGTWTWRVALSVADTIGSIAPRGRVVVPAFGTEGVRLSDLLLAAPGEGAPWVRPDGDTAYVTPRSQWFRDDPLTLYHEIYGLREGESYSSSLALKRGNRIVLSATYTGIGSFDVTRVYRTLSLKDVSPGDYTVEIAVKGERGPWARSSRALTVLKDR